MSSRLMTVGLGLCLCMAPIAALASLFDDAGDRYRKAVYDLQCCMVMDAAAESPDRDECPEVTNDGDLEEVRARDLCLMTYRKSHASGCDYEAVYQAALKMRAECTGELGKEKCGEARLRGMEDAREQCR